MLTQRQLFFDHVAQTTQFPMALEIVKAEGHYLYDADGKAYLDIISGIAVSNIGHRHPKVIKAITDQLDQYMHLMVYGEYIMSPQVKLAQKLVSLLPKPIDKVYFVNSGSEAVEGALKLAKRHTGRSEIISFNKAYHGSTHGALSVMGDEQFKNSFRPLVPGCWSMPFNDFSALDQISTKTAAVIVEPIQGEAGIVPATIGYLEKLREICTSKGVLLIVDEIQTGFGRTGKMFGFEHSNMVPDIVLMAKSLGGGMPIGAFAASSAIMNSFTSDPILGHITTFGGHPVCCAAALANIEVIQDNSLIAGISQKEELFLKELTHPRIKTIRSKGLMMAIQLENSTIREKAVAYCLENGLIIDWFLFSDDCLRIAPPLSITETEIIKSCGIIKDALTTVI